MTFFDAIGLFGVACAVGSYGLLACGKVQSRDLIYLWLNIIGSVALLVSVVGAWNIGTCLINVFWIAISVYGLFKRKASV